MTEKQCATCSAVKPISEFHVRRFNRKTKTGEPYVYEHTSNSCKTCEHNARVEYGRTPWGKESSRRQWETNEKRRNYANTPEGKAARERYRGTAKDQVRQSRQSVKRRSRVAADHGTLTAEEWAAVCALYHMTCAYCRSPLEKDAELGHPRKLTMDHVLPLIRGGTHTKDNVVPACWRCNERKGEAIIRPLAPPTDTQSSHAPVAAEVDAASGIRKNPNQQAG